MREHAEPGSVRVVVRSTTWKLLPLFCVAIAAMTAGCHSSPPVLETPHLPSISGTINLNGSTTVPENSVLAIRLVDLGKRDESRVIVEQLVSQPDKFPFRFRLYYEDRSIDYSRDYGVEAAVTQNGRAIWSQPQPNPVLTKNRPQVAEITLQPVKEQEPGIPGG